MIELWSVSTADGQKIHIALKEALDGRIARWPGVQRGMAVGAD